MDLRLMGDVEIYDGTKQITLSRGGERSVLASLALEPGRRIHIDILIDRIWGDDPPDGAVATIAHYVRTVRKAIEKAGGRREWLQNHRPASYALAIDRDLVDYHRFTALVQRARVKQRDGRPADAVGLYRQALALRTGDPLGNAAGRWAVESGRSIEDRYIEAVMALYEQQLAIGEYAEVASHATNFVMNIVPTDRVITLALYGLAGAGQHAAISGFLTRAMRRMEETAHARPGRQVFAIARQLIADPHAQLPEQPATGVGPAQLGLDRDALTHDQGRPAPREDATGDAAPTDPPLEQDGEAATTGPVRHGTVIITAEHNRRVYQAAGDQYIIGG